MLVKITRGSGIPLVGAIQFGVIDRGSNLLQIRSTTVCNLRCPFCSTRAGEHETDYEVEVNYLLDWIKEIANFKGNNLIAFVESVGEVLCYSKILELIRGIKKIKEFKEIVLITNGVLLTKEKIKKLRGAGVDKINLSIHSLDLERAETLAGCKYNLLHIIDMAECIVKEKIKLILTPVYIPGYEKDIEDLILLSKKLNCEIGIQKYEIHKNGRKLKGIKKMNYYKFYKKMRDWEKKFKVKLVLKGKDFGIERGKRLESIFKRGEKINVEIKQKGWWKGQYLGVKNNRIISVIGKNLRINSVVNVKIIESKNNLYIAKKF